MRACPLSARKEKKIDKHIRTQFCVQSLPHTEKTVTLCGTPFIQVLTTHMVLNKKQRCRLQMARQ